MEHKIKITSCYYRAVETGKKLFEIRLDDRGYQAGDTLILQEYDETRQYTGQELVFNIGYVTSYEQKPGFVVFSLIDQDNNSFNESIRERLCHYPITETNSKLSIIALNMTNNKLSDNEFRKFVRNTMR